MLNASFSTSLTLSILLSFFFFFFFFLFFSHTTTYVPMLPYQNLQEAEVALGKELSFAQNLWFNYSANKSDYFLYAHNLFFLLLFYTIVPLPLALMELKGSKSMEKYKLQPKVKCSYKDMIRCYKDVVKVFFIAVGPLTLVSYPLIKWVGIRTNLQLSSGWEMFWQILLYFIVEDYGNYWIHRWLHGKWGYEHIHWMHHEFTAPIGFAAPYAHWAEILALGFPAFVGPALAPCHLITFWLWMVLRQIESIETHCGYDFPWTPSKYIPFYGGAEYHDYHHYIGGQSQSNFASVFTYCDYIYGTDKGYRYQKGVLQKGKKEKI